MAAITVKKYTLVRAVCAITGWAQKERKFFTGLGMVHNSTTISLPPGALEGLEYAFTPENPVFAEVTYNDDKPQTLVIVNTNVGRRSSPFEIKEIRPAGTGGQTVDIVAMETFTGAAIEVGTLHLRIRPAPPEPLVVILADKVDVNASVSKDRKMATGREALEQLDALLKAQWGNGNRDLKVIKKLGLTMATADLRLQLQHLAPPLAELLRESEPKKGMTLSLAYLLCGIRDHSKQKDIWNTSQKEASPRLRGRRLKELVRQSQTTAS